MGPHTTSDDPTRYRSDDEVAAWAGLDPIDRCRAYLQCSGLWDEELDQRAQQRAASLRTALRDCVYDAPDGSVGELFDHVFVEPTALQLAQRAELLAELDREA
jgi:pyruvate dehydrogenase E1 component alpha subunit